MEKIEPIPEKGDILYLNCDTNGYPIGSRAGIPPHYFIVLSSQGYNLKSDAMLAMPCTSKNPLDFTMYQEILEPDMIENYCFSEDTYVYTDRPCRICQDITIIARSGKHGKAVDAFLRKISFRVQRFIAYGGSK